MISQRRPEYIIHMWHGFNGNGVTPMLRTYSREQWLEKISEIIEEEHIQERQCRVMERGHLTIFSYTKNESGFFSWRFAEMVKQPDSCVMGYPKGIVKK